MRHKTILFVDDEELIRTLFDEAFVNAGYTVRTAQNGFEALEILKREPILVAFLDLNMPGLNGVELCKRIKQANPMCFVFAVTGYASLFELDDCIKAGFNDYFTKPVKLELLYDAAEQAFKKLARWEENEKDQ